MITLFLLPLLRNLIALVVTSCKKIEISKVFLHEVHERRFSTDYKMVKKIIKKGLIGTIETISGSLSSSLKIYND